MSELNPNQGFQEDALQGAQPSGVPGQDGQPPAPATADPVLAQIAELQKATAEAKAQNERLQQENRTWQSRYDKLTAGFRDETQQPQGVGDVAFQNAYAAMKQNGFSDKDATDFARAQASAVHATVSPILAQLQATQALQGLPSMYQQAAVNPVVTQVLQDQQAYRQMDEIVQWNIRNGQQPSQQMIENAAYMAWGPLAAKQMQNPQQLPAVQNQPVNQQPYYQTPQPIQFQGTTFQAPGGFQLRVPQGPQLNPGDQAADANINGYIERMKAQQQQPRR